MVVAKEDDKREALGQIMKVFKCNIKVCEFYSKSDT